MYGNVKKVYIRNISLIIGLLSYLKMNKTNDNINEITRVIDELNKIEFDKSPDYSENQTVPENEAVQDHITSLKSNYVDKVSTLFERVKKVL